MTQRTPWYLVYIMIGCCFLYRVPKQKGPYIMAEAWVIFISVLQYVLTLPVCRQLGKVKLFDEPLVPRDTAGLHRKLCCGSARCWNVLLICVACSWGIGVE